MATTQASTGARISKSGAASIKPRNARKEFDPESFLATAGVGRTSLNLRKNEVLFTQGEPADAVFYIRKGKLKLAVVSKQGKVATIALLDAGEFIGEACVAGAEPLRQATASAITDCEVLKITRKEMVRVL